MELPVPLAFGIGGAAATAIGAFWWWGGFSRWMYMRQRLAGWPPLAILTAGIALMLLGAALGRLVTTTLPALAVALIAAAIALGLAATAFLFFGAPYSLLPRWLRRRIDSGDPAIQPDLPEHLWPLSQPHGTPRALALSTPHDAAPTSQHLLTTLRAGSLTLAIRRAFYARAALASLALAATLGWFSLRSLDDGNSPLALVLLLPAAPLVLLATLAGRVLLGGGGVVVGNEGLARDSESVRWEEVEAIGVREGAYGRVVLALKEGSQRPRAGWWRGLATVHTQRTEYVRPAAHVLLPVLRENPWDAAEALALAHAEQTGPTELAAPVEPLMVTWVRVVADPVYRDQIRGTAPHLRAGSVGPERQRWRH
ncbi:MAG: hypothetical protein Q4G64_09125 [bacterium]|nr:hypothetical protein [bacterium]